jgi:hypothetical protein
MAAVFLNNGFVMAMPTVKISLMNHQNFVVGLQALNIGKTRPRICLYFINHRPSKKIPGFSSQIFGKVNVA